jgi:hypothetical protein
MLKLGATACIDAPVNDVWAVLSDLGAIHVWVRAIERSYCPARERGVGATRVCELKQADRRNDCRMGRGTLVQVPRRRCTHDGERDESVVGRAPWCSDSRHHDGRANDERRPSRPPARAVAQARFYRDLAHSCSRPSNTTLSTESPLLGARMTSRRHRLPVESRTAIFRGCGTPADGLSRSRGLGGPWRDDPRSAWGRASAPRRRGGFDSVVRARGYPQHRQRGR